MTSQAVPVPFCRIFGTTEIEIGGVQVDLGGPTHTQVLPFDLGDPVSGGPLTEQVWRARWNRCGLPGSECTGR